MKMLTKNDYKEIRTWIYKNARPLDLAMWKVIFEDGACSDVGEILAFYQNADGGFGNGVEPDCWNTESSPYATMIAAGALRMIGFVEKEGVNNPIVQGIFRYLESGVQRNEEGWFFCIPSNDEFPRAPWWTYSDESNHLHGMGITAGLCSFVLHYGDPESKLFETAMDYTRRILERAAVAEEFGEMGAGGIFMLIGEIHQKGLESAFELEGLSEKLMGVMNNTIERDEEKWAFYTPRPSGFIDSPMNPLYKENKELVERELDYTIETRTPGGVWNITWTWFDLGETYPKEFAISENWWMANKAMEKLGFLMSFGRIEK